MAEIIQGPWKPFPIHAVTQVGTGTWECTIIKLRPRRPFPSEAMLPQLERRAAISEEPAAKPAS